MLGNALCEDKNAPFRLAFGDPTFNAITWDPFQHENMKMRWNKGISGCPVCKRAIYQGCVDYDWIEEQKIKYGERSKTYKMRVLAEFPDPIEYGKRWIIDPADVADAAGMEYADITSDDLEQTRKEFLRGTKAELEEEGFSPGQAEQWLQTYHS